MLCKPGVYLFVIRDTHGDGICCDDGNGSFSLSIDGKELFIQDGEYETHATVVLRIDGIPEAYGISDDMDVAEVRGLGNLHKV